MITQRWRVALAGALALVAAPLWAAADFSGVWQVIGGGGGGSDAFAKFPESQWNTEKLPLTVKGRAAFEANKPGKGPRLFHNPHERNDPLVKGNPPGLYRTLVYARPMEFVAAPDKLVQVFEWGRAWRSIYLDGRPVPKDIPEGPFWYGYSVGRWDGDTLVVETMALDARAWFDEWGTPITDNAHITERWRRVAPDRLQVQLVVNDPEYYTKAWTSAPIGMRLQKKGVEAREVIHAPIDEEAFEQTITGPAGDKR